MKVLLFMACLLLYALIAGGCATSPPYEDDYYADQRVRRDRYGQYWYRCRVRDGYPAWCRRDD